MIPGKYTFVKHPISDCDEIVIPGNAYNAQVISPPEDPNYGESQFYVIWLERHKTFDNFIKEFTLGGLLFITFFIMCFVFWGVGMSAIEELHTMGVL